MIVDLGVPSAGTRIDLIIQSALDMLPRLRRDFDVVAVSFEFNGTRVSVWPDDTVQQAYRRWAEERERQQAERSAPREPEYVGKRRRV